MGLDSILKPLMTGGRKPIDSERFRRAKPIRNPRVVQHEASEDGTVVLEAPLEDSQSRFSKLLARWAKAPTTKRFELEGVGAFVWNHCDGQTTVEGIARRLKEQYKMNRVEAEAALTSFLQTLGQRGLITLLVPPKK